MAGKIKNQEPEQPALTQKEELILKAQSLGIHVNEHDTVPILKKMISSVEEHLSLNIDPFKEDPNDRRDLFKKIFVKLQCNNPKLMNEGHLVLSFTNDIGKPSSVFIHLDYEDMLKGMWLSKWVVKLLKQRKFVIAKPNFTNDRAKREDGFVLEMQNEFNITYDPKAYINGIAGLIREQMLRSKPSKHDLKEAVITPKKQMVFSSPSLDVATVDEKDLVK